MEIKPCPCGHKPMLCQHSGFSCDVYSIICDICGARGLYASSADNAAWAWDLGYLMDGKFVIRTDYALSAKPNRNQAS